MFWIITKDCLNEKNPSNFYESRVGTYMTTGNRLLDAAIIAAPSEAIPGILEGCKNVCDHEFRLYDDDGELYYEGLCHRLDHAPEGSAFEPLDWAMNEAGCTRMDYRKKGETKWKTL